MFEELEKLMEQIDNNIKTFNNEAIDAVNVCDKIGYAQEGYGALHTHAQQSAKALQYSQQLQMEELKLSIKLIILNNLDDGR
jgi:hypothetical protein